MSVSVCDRCHKEPIEISLVGKSTSTMYSYICGMCDTRYYLCGICIKAECIKCNRNKQIDIICQ